jgi:hypothetical protein
MPDDKRSDDVEKLLAEEGAVEDRKKSLIADLLKQREASLKDFDDKLAKLGHHPDGKQKRNHHRKGTPSAAGAEAQPRGKAKA